ncbi:MAG TPA: glycoside hydrolase family protein [Burkholderiales bacterium]|nr:glycoside hydrolase family protein [Burkholderiales bacterium]
MTDDARLAASTSGHEGFEPHPYKDTRNLWTFGKGRCLETNPLSAMEWRHLLDEGLIAVSISEDGATWLMRKGLLEVEEQCAQAFDFWPSLNDARQNAVVEMAYQMGFDKLSGFRKMLAAIRAGDWQTAHDEALDSAWHKQTPVRAEKVAEQLRSGQFAS